MKRTCIQCGAEFEIEEKEAAFYESKDFELPKRCKECRQKNKMAQRQQRNNYYQNRNNTNRQNYRPKYQGQNTERHNYQPNYQGKRSNGSQPYWKTYDEWQDQSSNASEQRSTVQHTSDVSTKKKTPKWIAAVLAAVLLLCGGGTGYWYHEQQQESEQTTANPVAEQVASAYQFRNDEYLTEHFEKHGAELGYTSKESYLAGANQVIASAEALHKQEAEDGDDIYFLEKTSELVVLSTDGYIRTYFKPEDGMAYYERQ